jgi:hypothetical protein
MIVFQGELAININELQMPSNRNFGYFFTVVLLVTAVYLVWLGKISSGAIVGIVGTVFGVITVVRDRLLAPLNRNWMLLGLGMGKIINPIVLAALFFGLFTPIAIVMRLIGRDELQLEPSNSDTFWKYRDSVECGATFFKQQF